MNEDKGSRYHRLCRRADRLAAALSAAVLLAWAAGPATEPVLRALAPRVPTALAWLLVYLAVAASVEGVRLPLRFYADVTLGRRYDRPEPARWGPQAVADAAVHWGLVGLGIVAAYGLMVVAPRAWWIAGAALWGMADLAARWAAPAWLVPRLAPSAELADPAMAQRLGALLQRAGLQGLNLRVWNSGRDLRQANARVAGIGRRRIVLVSESLLQQFAADEVEVVVAHEIAHHVRRDVLREAGVLAATRCWTLMAGGWLLVQWSLRDGALPWTAPAGFPRLIFAGALAHAFAVPLVNLAARSRERRADAFALALTGNVNAFVSALRRLGAHALADGRPTWADRLWYYSHPPFEERIRRAETAASTAQRGRTTSSPRMARQPSSTVKLQ